MDSELLDPTPDYAALPDNLGPFVHRERRPGHNRRVVSLGEHQDETDGDRPPDRVLGGALEKSHGDVARADEAVRADGRLRPVVITDHDVRPIGRGQSPVQTARHPDAAVGLRSEGDLGFHNIELRHRSSMRNVLRMSRAALAASVRSACWTANLPR